MTQAIMHRREALQVGFSGVLGVTLPMLLEARSRAATRRPRVRSVVLVFLQGQRILNT